MIVRILLSLALFQVASAPRPALAQYPFGKNKVVYENRDWKVLKTEHVDIYHYPSDANLIVYVAPLVEETYLEFRDLFDLEFDRPVPFVFYNSHYDFQETNVIPSIISEYTGGFTDLMKGRIAVPFTGQFATFRHVARHEMVHAFMLEKLQRVMKDQGKFTYAHPPLWFTEGIAEYFANSIANTQGNMYVRDALFHNRLLDLENLWRIQGSFMMYKEGEAVVDYVATNFGDEAVIQILENWWTGDSFEMVLENTIDMSMEQLNDAFMKHVKRRYYPTVMNAQFATDIGERLTAPRTFHNQGVAGIDKYGELEIHALCAQDGVLNICRMGWSEEGKPFEKTIVKGGRSAAVESLPAFRSKIEVHGDTLLFVAKSENHDRIYLWNVRKKKAFNHFQFEELSLLSSPTLSGDRRRIVFSAIDTDGKMDLYRYHIPDKRLERLTNDGFSEEDPDYHPYEETILFTSDRGSYGRRDRTHIYKLDIESGEITAMEGGRHADSDAEWAPNGRTFLFVSDREGTFNVYHNKGSVVVRQTNVIGGVNTPSFLPHGRSFIATTYMAGEFHIFEYPIRNGSGRVFAAQAPDSTTISWQQNEYTIEDFETQDYGMKLGVDFVGAGVSVDPESGDVGNGGQIVLTDMLGNHQFHTFFATTTSDVSSDFWKNVNAGVTYVNLSHRIHYSLSAFTLNSENLSTLDIGDRETRTGGAVGLSLPLNRFQRIDLSLVGRQIDRWFFDQPLKSGLTGSAFLTYVEDHTLWTIGGPLTGHRYYVTGGQTLDFEGDDFAHSSLQVDFRKYFKITRRSVFATRIISRNSWGDDDLVFYIGGPWTLRGYGFRDFFGRSTHLVNTEFRFPVIDNFSLALPFGVIELPMFRGAVFFDAGAAQRNVNPRWDTDWIGSVGLGVELNLGYAPVIRVNFTRALDFRRIFPDWGTELFIGYNF